jgi:hypothetical protein
MPTKLIVTGLGDEIRDEDLYDLFDVYGVIVDLGVEDRASLGSTGYVVYQEGGCAMRARLGMDGADVNGRRIAVRPVVRDPRCEGPAVCVERGAGPWVLHHWK